MELNEFFTHGVLKGFHLAMTIEQVQQHRPGIGFTPGIDPEVLISNTEEFEVTMYKGLLVGLILNPRFVKRGYLRFVDGKRYRLTFRTSLRQCIRSLERAGIHWSFERDYTLGRQVCIRTSGGVDLIFGFDDPAEELAKIALWRMA